MNNKGILLAVIFLALLLSVLIGARVAEIAADSDATVIDAQLVPEPVAGPGMCEALGNIEVHATSGTLTAGYPQLNLAFSAIN
ncbi:MAG TPA: hypothetical protein VNA17_11370, partial [Pyrinomonadaceae bacterium]|nr:hypothetical protein [Pyrinomonadaceae bacterium]